MGHSKLVSPLGTQLWKLSDLFQFCIIEESWASECRKIEFLKSEVIKFWEQKFKLLETLRVDEILYESRYIYLLHAGDRLPSGL